MTIQSFRDERARRLLEEGLTPRRMSIELARAAQRKLTFLNDATTLSDLARLRGNRLELLRGDRAGQHSIRVNDQYRLCFVWTEFGPSEVELVDYHR